MVTGLEIAAVVYVAGFCVMLGMGVGHEADARDPEWAFVVFAAVAWPFILGRLLVLATIDHFRNG